MNIRMIPDQTHHHSEHHSVNMNCGRHRRSSRILSTNKSSLRGSFRAIFGHRSQQSQRLRSQQFSNTNRDGYVTMCGVESIDTFLLCLRFYGFDLWLSRLAETGQRQRIRNAFTKTLFYIALFFINFQLLVHIITLAYHFKHLDMDFCDVMDDLRTFMLKFTMVLVVNLWHKRSHIHSGMAHLVVINYLKTNSASSLRRIALCWLTTMLACTVTHWAVSQYWVSSMSTEDQCRWLNIVTYLVNGAAVNFKDFKSDLVKTAMLRSAATADSFVYRMLGYGGRIALTCAYCLFTSLLHQCMKQMNTMLSEHLESEYHYHHYYCRKNRLDSPSSIDSWTSACEIKYRRSLQFDLETFKHQYKIVYRIHHQIEQCFGQINFIFFGSLFFVSCIDIFFLAWKAGTEWFRVWSLLEFTSLAFLWLPHMFLIIKGSQISSQSHRMKLYLKDLCRTNDSIRRIIHSPSFYPNIRPTIYGVVPLDLRFFLSFICTLATFSVMTIQLNPSTTPKVGKS